MITQTQIQIENQERYQQFLKDISDEELTFEQYINTVLGQMSNGECEVKDVVYFPSTQEFLIIYVSKN